MCLLYRYRECCYSCMRCGWKEIMSQVAGGFWTLVMCAAGSGGWDLLQGGCGHKNGGTLFVAPAPIELP